MNRKKLNCIWDQLRQGLPGTGGLLALLLAAVLFATPAVAAADNGAIPQATLQNKPEVTIQGNVVVDDNGAPTGFYELALCVRSPRRVYGPDPAMNYAAGSERELSEAEYAQVLADIEAGTAGVTEADYAVTYYPFSAASAVVGVNTDVLTAVHWDLESVTYSEWDGANYADQDAAYPRGIVLTDNVDPEVWGPTDPDPFPDVTQATLQKPRPTAIALDAEGDRSAFTAAAQVDQYYEDTATNTKTALVTLSAHAPDNKPVVFKTSTPVAVVRFSYDLKRFPKNVVMVNAAYNGANISHQITGENDAAKAEGFWLGLDRANAYLLNDGKTPLTWLADTAQGGNFAYSDGLAAATEAGQTVWTKLSSKDTAGGAVDWEQTEYYYYLGANAVAGSDASDPDGTVSVSTPAGIQDVEHIRIPSTQGVKVLGHGGEENPQPAAGDTWTAAPYSYYSNLLYLDGPAEGRGLKLKMVNAPTFRAPRGGKGGNQILFYDWDDTLIGALIVGEGDVRRDVNQYVEKNLVHPDLRSGDILSNSLGGNVPDFTTPPAAGSAEETYQNLVTSLDREWTYRGQYPQTPSPEGTTTGAYPEDPTDPAYDPDLAGSAFPLTNKLDYVFYKHLNTVTTVETQDTSTGKQWTENYFTLDPLTADPEAAKYPWAYGWAVVEDAVNQTVLNKANWPVMVDSVKLSDTWTTFGVGELEGMDPGAGNVNGAFATPAPGTTQQSVYPGGLSTDWSADPTKDPTTVGYTYQTSSADANRYLRFADFSDMSTLLKDGQNVIIVKAVYEPGTDLDLKGYYSIVPDSLSISRLGTAASSENSIYAFDYQYQRANASTGNLIGVGRTRDPAVRTGFVFDAKAVDTKEDLDAQKTFFLKNIGANTDIMDIQLTTGGALWKLEYTLLDIYGRDISNGTARSLGGEWDLKTGFVYETPADPSVEWSYDERQGTDGFVVEATLNTLLAEATKEAKESGSGNLSNHVSLYTLQDLNFKRAVGTPPVEFTGGTARRFTTYLQDLVNRLYADKVSIDPKTGNVVLGWHQIQQHIILCEAAGGVAVPGIYSGGVLKSEGDCIAIGYEWCRMDTCGGNSTMPINSYHDVLKALNIINKGSSDPGYNPAYKAIYGEAGTANTGVTATDLFSYGFRYHPDGVPYSAADPNLKDSILNDLKDAVKLLAPTLGTDPDWSTVTWAQVQTAILQGNGHTVSAGATHWWEPTVAAPNGTPPIPTTGEETLASILRVVAGVDTDKDGQPNADAKVPDHFDSFTAANVTKAQIDAMFKEDFDGKASSDLANFGWLRKGVDNDGKAVEFANADELGAALTTALTEFAKNGYDTLDELKTLTWEQVQYTVITGKFKSHADVLAETSGKAPGPLSGQKLYWNKGGLPELEFDVLLEAINEYYASGGKDSAKLDALLAKGIDPVNNEVYLRKDDTGAAFESASEFKTIIRDAISALDIVSADGYTYFDGGKLDPAKVDQYFLQYILIHYKEFNGSYNVPDKDAIKADPVNNDYWWFDGGAPSGPMPIRNIKELLSAYFWYVGPTAGVSGQNPAALDNLDETVMKTLGLRSDAWGVPYASITKTQVIAALQKLPYQTVDDLGLADADTMLKELQNILITGSYASAGTITDVYWWQEGDKSYPTPTNQTEVLEAVWKAHVGNAAGHTVPEAETALKALDMDFITNRKGGLAMRKDADGKAFADAEAFYTALCQAADAMKAGGQGYSDLGNITQRQLQWMLLGNAYDTDANIQDATIDKSDPDPEKWVDDYWWFKYDKKPEQGGPTITVKPLDESKVSWNSFMNAASEYAMNWDSSQMGAIFPANDETLLNVSFLLRKSLNEADTFGSVGELYDESWGDMLYNVINLFFMSDRAGDFSSDGVSFDVRVPTWDEFQYAVIHYDEISANGNILPSQEDIKEEAEEKYTWRYVKSGGEDPKPPEPEKEEKPLDESNVTWSDFISASWEYAMNWDNGPIDNILGVYDESLLNNDFLLRQSLDETDVFTSNGDLYDCSWGDKLYNVINVFFLSDRAGDFTSDGYSFDVATPTWYEFQYALIHYDEISASGNVLPTLDVIKAEAEEKWTWRYTTPTPPTPPPPAKTEKDIDESRVSWNDFINAAWEYAQNWDNGPIDTLLGGYDETLFNDDFLLRKSLSETDTFGSIGDLYDQSWGDMLYNVTTMFFMSDRVGDFSSDSFTFDVAVPSWYEFQYIIIHYDEISASGNILPSLEDIKAECEEKWDWKYTTEG